YAVFCLKKKKLTTGSTYSVSVTAVYRDGKESACSAIASVVAQPDIAVTPIGPVSFGIVTIENSATQTLNIQSTRNTTADRSPSSALFRLATQPQSAPARGRPRLGGSPRQPLQLRTPPSASLRTAINSSVS